MLIPEERPGTRTMKIANILDKIDEFQLFVPAFQREYVWKRDDAKQLLDSLLKEYPTGTNANVGNEYSTRIKRVS